MVTVLVVLYVCGCSTWPRRWGNHPCCIQDKPVVRRQSISWHLFDVSVLEPVKQTAHLVRLARRWAGVPVRAVNLKDGNVPDTTFFTNRDPRELTPEQVRWGPARPEDIPVGPFTIVKPKVEGKTAGFFVKDARGTKYLFKLDPVDAPELLSGAEVVTSKLIYALGYHVPVYEIVYLRPEELQLADGVMYKDRRTGTKRPFTAHLLDELIRPRMRDGRVRVVASRIVDGEVLGPARFKKFRDCADMRALKLVYAWVNNIDTKDHNSLLVWDGARTNGYLIDFGTTLGADAGLGGPKKPCEGATYVVDFKELALEGVTFGRHEKPCDTQAGVVSPAVGRFAPHFEPSAWKPYAPNWAFHEMNEQDAKWIARRMHRLSREQIAAAVTAGRYSDPKDAAYLTDALVQRRDDIVRRYGDLEEEDER